MTAYEDAVSKAWARIPRPGAWSFRAKCRDLDVWESDRLFFPPSGGHDTASAARAFCNPCPVRAECITFAREHHPRGVWGGESENERSKVLGRPRFEARRSEADLARQRTPEYRERRNARRRAQRAMLREAS